MITNFKIEVAFKNMTFFKIEVAFRNMTFESTEYEYKYNDKNFNERGIMEIEEEKHTIRGTTCKNPSVETKL